MDDLANVFLIDTDVDSLPTDQADQARNLTREIFVVQQKDVNVTINFVNDVSVEPDASGGVINAVRQYTNYSFESETKICHAYRKEVIRLFSYLTQRPTRETSTPLSCWPTPRVRMGAT